MNIAAITFQGSFNYGSMLQAYALQTSVEKLARDKHIPCNYQLINLRTEYQKNYYSALPKPRGLKNAVKWFMRMPYLSAYKKRSAAFEQFLSNELHTTKEISNEAALLQNFPDFDVYISGSDQIWNVRASDFLDAYYLPFVKQGRKISYAASFGPLPIDWNKYNKEKYGKLLREYSAISVREAGSAENVKLLTGQNAPVHIDPTLLLTKEQWRNIQDDTNVRTEPYILMYCLEASKEQLAMIKQISASLKLPVVITQYRNKHDYFNPFTKAYSTGPKEFLSLIDHASCVVTSSFHGTVFSILYEKPFIVLNGMSDRRISNLLEMTGMEGRSVTSETIEKGLESLDHIDYATAAQRIADERQRSIKYLESALNI